jgi:hypothetical protein
MVNFYEVVGQKKEAPGWMPLCSVVSEYCGFQAARAVSATSCSNVHLIEIDLLRRGTRHFNHPRLPETTYLVRVTGVQSGAVEVWSIRLQDSQPTIPIDLSVN